jgi:PPOX class probable FMN-dependent enzyme
MISSMGVTQPPHLITDEAQLRAIIGEQPAAATLKIADHVNPLTARFIAASPFVLVATGSADPGGGLDVSPRGDPAGFVRVLDERTLLLPERPGNRIADTLTNLLSDDRIALLFLIPGVGTTFRVNGRAQITDDAELLAPSSVEGKPPKLGLIIYVETAYTQCPKAVFRSGLWDPAAQTTAEADLPSGGEILASLREGFDAAAYDRARAERYARREGFY